MTAVLDVLWAIARRSWSAVLRRPVLLTFSLGQPLIWMLFFGFLFERYRLVGLPRMVAYPDFLAPGVAAMTVLFGTSQSGIGWIRDLQTGFLPRMLAAPVRPEWILAGKVLADAIRVMVQAAVLLLLALTLGVQLHPEPIALVLATFSLLLFAVAFASLSCAVALRTQAQEVMATFVHLVNMPLLFTSSALVPRQQMPDWLAEVCRFNPLTTTVEALRGALLFGERPSLVATLAPLGVLTVMLFLLASAQMRHAAKQH